MGQLTKAELRKIYNRLMANVETSNYFHGFEGFEVDWKIAYHLYNYLLEASLELPSYEMIEVARNKTITNVISMGYGFDVTKDMGVTYVTPITNTKSRVDHIEYDKYYAFISGSTEIEAIDTNEYPIFPEEKVRSLQVYLGKTRKHFALKDAEKKVRSLKK